jgi:outer membrane protein OmpU
MSGSARMGLYYDGADTTLDNRFTVNIDGKVETTSGLTFGARMRLRTSDGAAGTSPNGARVYMTSGPVTVAVGNINGAIDSMPNLYHSEVGYAYNIAAGDVVTVNYDGYASNGGELGAEVIYSSDSFGAHLSVTDPSLGSTEERTAAHVSYTVGGWTLAVGTQQATGHDLTVVTAAGSVGDYGIGFSAADNNGTTKMTLAGSATMGATGVSAFVSDEEGATDTAFGLGLTYDLGGASLGAGVQQDTSGDNQAEVGVSFSF